MNGTYIFEIVNRTIVPSATEELAVVNDNDSRYITFKIPSVIDGIDITDKILTVRYVNSLNRYDQFFCNTREVITEGNEQFVLFDWVLDSNVTSAKGTVTYDISIYDTNDMTNVSQYILHTKPATFQVEEGLLDTGAPIEDENALQAAIDSFNAIAAKYYNDTLAASKTAQAAADAAAKSAASLKIDTTLTISGYAADAKTVGDKLAGKAESSEVTSIRSDLQNEIDRATDTDSQLEEELVTLKNMEDSFLSAKWIRGYLDSTGTANDASYRAVFEDYIICASDVTVSVLAGYQFAVGYKNSDGSTILARPYDTNAFVIPANIKFKVSVYALPEDTSSGLIDPERYGKTIEMKY